MAVGRTIQGDERLVVLVVAAGDDDVVDLEGGLARVRRKAHVDGCWPGTQRCQARHMLGV